MASAGAGGDGHQPRVLESPRFSALRAHLQGLALRKPERYESSSAASAARRPMQSSVPRPRRPAGSGAAPASSLTHFCAAATSGLCPV